MNKKCVIFLFIPLLFSCGQNGKESVNVKFLNGSNILLENTFREGDVPVYTGSTPTKDSIEDGNYLIEYSFTGWAPSLGPVYTDTEYTAVFNSQRNYNFNKFRSNHSNANLISFMNSNGTSSTSYTEINGHYADYACKKYNYYANSTLEYFADYNLWRVVIRSGSDLAMTSFRFQSFNSTNSGMLMSVNGRTLTTTISINSSTLEANSPYSFVNTGLYEMNIFSCEKGGVILSN